MNRSSSNRRMRATPAEIDETQTAHPLADSFPDRFSQLAQLTLCQPTAPRQPYLSTHVTWLHHVMYSMAASAQTNEVDDAAKTCASAPLAAARSPRCRLWQKTAPARELWQRAQQVGRTTGQDLNSECGCDSAPVSTKDEKRMQPLAVSLARIPANRSWFAKKRLRNQELFWFQCSGRGRRFWGSQPRYPAKGCVPALSRDAATPAPPMLALQCCAYALANRLAPSLAFCKITDSLPTSAGGCAE